MVLNQSKNQSINQSNLIHYLDQRFVYQEKKIRKKHRRSFNFDLGEIIAVTIMEGELLNEAVSSVRRKTGSIRPTLPLLDGIIT